MPETRPPYDDEIELIEILQTLWNGKWIILATVLILSLGIYGYLSFQKTYSSLWPPIYFSYAPFQLIRRA